MELLEFVRGLSKAPSKLTEGGYLSEIMAKLFGKNTADGFGLAGNVTMDHYRGSPVHDNLIATVSTPNYIVNAGLNEVAAMISTSGTGTKFSAIAVGNDSSATGAAQTDLESEIMRAEFTDAISSQTATFTATFTFTGTYTVYEAGIFNATESGGDMLSRRTMSAINVESGDTLVITWTITVGRS